MSNARTPRESVETLRREYGKARRSGFGRAMAVINLSQRFEIEPWKVRAFCTDKEIV